MLDSTGLQELLSKGLVTPAAMRQVVRLLQTRLGTSGRRERVVVR